MMKFIKRHKQNERRKQDAGEKKLTYTCFISEKK